ncbi:uncharacterized protein LOC5566712 isoform X2 [Aedes aegypti]|uniref:Uncharacterized protein n=1 Tax=Aedes aegypti TaxID=7159 RepID=A0A6R5I6Y6_AEDAE|nr:uncharacterized protein LOC5566712 isoform X2 [Aedes aegypti]
MAYNCTVCVFGSSIKSGGYQCVYCGNSFTDAGPSNSVGEKAASENELPRSGSEKWIFRCTFCNQDYVNREGMWNHLDSHDIADVGKSLHCKEIIVCYDLHECLICNDKRGYSEDIFSVHIQEAHNGFYFRCSSCNEQFRSEEQKSEHVSNRCKVACGPNMDTAVNDDSRQHANVTSQSEVSTNGNILPVDGESTAQLPKHLRPRIPHPNKARRRPKRLTIAADTGAQHFITSFEMFCRRRSAIAEQLENIIAKTEDKKINWEEVISSIVTGQISLSEASDHYSIPHSTLKERILGTGDPSDLLHTTPLSPDEEEKILKFCTGAPVEYTQRKAVIQPLETVWTFLKRFQSFRQKSDQFCFGGLLFFRWWWAFCRKHDIDCGPPKLATSDDSDNLNEAIPSADDVKIAELQMVISVVVTGRLTVAEASSRYGIPYVTLYNSVLGHQNRMGVLQKITLSREEEDQIMKYCVKPLPGRKAKKGITQPLEKIWEFLNCLKSFHEKADEFRFGEVSFYRWWWAFCRHHNIDVHPSKHVTRVNSESPSVDVATTLDDSETPIVDDGTNRVNEDDSTIPSWTRMAELKEAIFDIVTGQLSFPEASSQYNLSEHTLYSRILGQTDRMAVLQEVSLSIEEEDKILRLCTTIPPECTAKRIITQPLETIWDFMHHLGDFREKADQFRFGGIAFYRWFWAFCQKHNVDERLPKQETN